MPLLIPVVLLQIALAIHAVRTGRAQPWLWIILVFPMLGSVIYLAVNVLPPLLAGRTARRAATGVADLADPEREVRRLRDALELAPTVENRTRLATELLRIGRAQEAAVVFEACLAGMHAGDPKILTGLAEARFAAGDPTGTAAAIEALRQHDPNHHSADLHLLYARALEGSGRTDEALDSYAALADRYPGEEARARHAALLHLVGRRTEAEALFRAVIRNVEMRRGTYRQEQREWKELAERMLA